MNILRTVVAASALFAATGCSQEATELETELERTNYALAAVTIFDYDTPEQQCRSARNLAEHHRGDESLKRHGKRKLVAEIVNTFCGFTGEQCKAALAKFTDGDTSDRAFNAIGEKCAPPAAVLDPSMGLTEKGCGDGVLLSPTNNPDKKCCMRIERQQISTGETIIKAIACCGSTSGTSCTDTPTEEIRTPSPF